MNNDITFQEVANLAYSAVVITVGVPLCVIASLIAVVIYLIPLAHYYESRKQNHRGVVWYTLLLADAALTVFLILVSIRR